MTAVLAGLLSPRPLPLSRRGRLLAVPSQRFLRACRSLVSSLLIKTPIISDQGLTLMTSFNFTSLKSLSLNLVSWELRLQNMNMKGLQFRP